MTTPSVVRGQRVELPLNGNLLAPGFQTLLRAEQPSVNYWEVNVAPIYRKSVGPVIEGMPGFVAGGGAVDPGIKLRMTWGGGGVSYRTELFYPRVGASFCVSGDNIQLEAGLLANGSQVFTEENRPVVSAWVKPVGAPTSQAPLVSGFFAPEALYGPRFISPWTKALLVGKDTAAATVTVRLYSSPVLFTTFVWTGTGIERFPIADASYMAEVFASAGNVMVAEEYAFT